MRNSSLILISALAALILFGLTFVDAGAKRAAMQAAVERRASLVARLGLSDLALFTEAHYTRNPSLADRHTPFQSHPVAFEHFPSGSLLLPPEHLQ